MVWGETSRIREYDCYDDSLRNVPLRFSEFRYTFVRVVDKTWVCLLFSQGSITSIQFILDKVTLTTYT